MADPVYDDESIDLITLTFAVVLAAAIVFLLAQIVPQVADLCDAAAFERDTLGRWLRSTG